MKTNALSTPSFPIALTGSKNAGLSEQSMKTREVTEEAFVQKEKEPSQSSKRLQMKKVSFIKNVQKFLKVTLMVIKAVLCYVAQLVASGCEEIVRTVFFSKKRTAYHRLIKSDHPIKESEQAYSLNKALLSNISTRTDDPKKIRQAQFLSENYLGKVAPVPMSVLQWVIPGTHSNEQTNPNLHHLYHRYGYRDKPDIGQNLNKKLFSLANCAPLIPTDTIEFTQLYPLCFTPIDRLDEGFPIDILEEHITTNPKKPFSEPLKKPLLFDLTHDFKDIMTKDKEKEAKAKLHSLKKSAKSELERVVTQLSARYPNSSKKEIRKWLIQSSVFMCRAQDSETSACGIKLLPIFQDVAGAKYLKAYPSLDNFISDTGLFIGAVNLRRHIWANTLDTNKLDYTTKSTKPSDKINLYFKTPEEISESRLMKDLSKTFDNKSHPQFRVMGLGTLALIKGLMSEISSDKWAELHSDLFTQEVIQSSLYKIMTQLASARQQYEVKDFTKFSGHMECVHADIATLLEILRPFDESQYSANYKKIIEGFLDIDASYIKPTLCRTGMNAFAGINTAIMETNDRPVRAYGKGFYFEQAGFVGYDNTLDALLKDESIENIDLYACQFNPNIDVDSTLTHYEEGDVEGDIRKIFKQKPNTKHLTVAVDCTIDQVKSERMQSLIKTFKKEIEGGKINFVFFRSGQKLDQFGMDTYYGAPVIQVNNGAPYWKPFEKLEQDQAYKTDPLSQQWFNLAFKYATPFLESYRKLIFTNTRSILDSFPNELLPAENLKKQKVRINTASNKMLTSFIDIKLSGSFQRLRSWWVMGKFFEKLHAKGIKTSGRASFGFYHSNFIIIYINEIKDTITIRLTPGIDPKEVQLINEFIQEL